MIIQLKSYVKSYKVRAMNAARDVVQEIKDRLDIAEFIRQYVTLLPAGKNYKALCPFHKEKTPSFSVSPDRQLWYCFGGCAEGGDIIKFLMRYENLEFMEALKILAEKAGVDFKTSGGQDHKQYNVLYEINEVAKIFFQKNLEADKVAPGYLKNRGLREETIKDFELGLAGKEPDLLLKHLIKSGFNIADIEKAGLVVKSEKGLYWDRFRNRLMFPLYNHFGKAVGFTGRIQPAYENENVGKYVNSPETPIFNKSKLLYGFHKSKEAMRDSRFAVLVEGQMDFLMMWQDGVKNVVATSGTAVTGDHLKLLKRFADELILSFDSDKAGQTAAERTIDLAEANDFSVKVLKLDAKDPADVVKNQPGLMAKLIAKAEPAMQFYFSRYMGEKGRLDPGHLANFKRNIRVVLSKIKNIYSPVEKSHWLKELSKIANLDERTLFEEMNDLKTAPQRLSAENFSAKGSPRWSESEAGGSAFGGKKPQEGADVSRRDLIAQRIITLVLAQNELINETTEFRQYLPPAYQTALTAIASGTSLDQPVKNLIDLASLQSSLITQSSDDKKIRFEFAALFEQLKREYFKERRQMVGERIKNAESAGDEKALQDALKEFDQVAKMTQNI